MTLGFLAWGSMLQAQFILEAPSDRDESNYRWYEATDPGTVLGTDSTYPVNVPGVYFAVYDGTLCGKNATSYFIVTYCGNPDDQVTLDISGSVPSGATVSWDPAVSGDPERPTVTAQFGQSNIITYTPYVTKLGNTKKLPSFTVICLQGPFTLVDDMVVTDEDVALDINMLDNDSDIPGVGVISVTDPVNGTATVNTNGTPSDPSDDTITYTPDPDFSGTDTFTYELTVINSDGTPLTDQATITVTVNNVNDVPVAENDEFTVLEDSGPGPANQIDVRVNDDIGPDGGDGDDFILSTAPNNGEVTEVSDGIFEYIPNPNFNGIDSFVYTIIDADGTTDFAVVNVNVTPVNDAPIANDDVANTGETVPVTINVLVNDTDIDGDVLTVIATTSPSNGTLSINADGTITYTPDDWFSGTDTFTYTISDGNGGEDTATVTITVNESDVAVDDMITTDEDTDVIIAILDNDLIPDNATFVIDDITIPINGIFTLNADNTLTFTPEPDFNGVNQFEYTITLTYADGTVVTDTAIVTVEVLPVQDANPDYVELPSSGNTVDIVIDVLENDSFSDGTVVTVTDVSEPSYGTVTLNPDGTITYTSGSTETVNDTFTYTVTIVHSDGSTHTETAIIDVLTNVVQEIILEVHQLVTPNGDGQNDHLQIYGIENYPNNTVRIFNRWGVQVFEAQGYDNQNVAFRGYSEGRMTIGKDNKLPSGTYYYTIEFSENGIGRSKAGYFYINN